MAGEKKCIWVVVAGSRSRPRGRVDIKSTRSEAMAAGHRFQRRTGSPFYVKRVC